jgi:hypothetical protein
MEVGMQNRERSRFSRAVGDRDDIAWETIDAEGRARAARREQTGGLSVRIATANPPVDYSIR